MGEIEKNQHFLHLYDTTVKKNCKIASKATITRCDLSPRLFCIDATLLCEFESDKI